jgi:probable O-glycosylation ligase (exosortase A-associated)
MFPADTDRSAQGRIHAWIVAWNIAKDYPLTGAGFDFEGPETVDRWQSYGDPEVKKYISTYQAAHSIYFQLLGQHGFIGLGLWLTLLLFALRSLQRLNREHMTRPEHAWIAHYASAIQIGLIGYMVSGAFLSSGYFDLVYLYVSFTAILGREAAAIKAEARKAASIPAGRLAGLVRPESLNARGAAQSRP